MNEEEILREHIKFLQEAFGPLIEKLVEEENYDYPEFHKANAALAGSLVDYHERS